MNWLRNRKVFNFILFLWFAFVTYGYVVLRNYLGINVQTFIILLGIIIFSISIDIWHRSFFEATDTEHKAKKGSVELFEIKMKCKKKTASKRVKHGRKIIPRKNELAKLNIADFVPMIENMTINEFNKWSLILFEDCYTMMKFHYRRRPIRWFFAKDCITVFQMLLSSLAGEKQLDDSSSVDEKLDVLLEHFVLRNSPLKHSKSICSYLGGFVFVANNLDSFDKPLKMLETKEGTDVFDEISHLPFFIIEDGLTKMSNDAFLKKAYEAAVKLIS